jgi:predicted membrane chloride channel (bestrophin family)
MGQLTSYLARIIFSAIIYFILKYFAKDKRKFNRNFFTIYGLIIVFELVFGYIIFKYNL